MAIDKITPRQLNKDEDYLLVKTTEMVDALNIRMTEDDDGNRGVLKNIKGNTEITLSGGDVLPAGTNRIVGTCSYNQKDLIFFFVWNSNDDHCIYQINTSGTATKVLTGSYIELEKTSVIHSSAIEDANNEILLYFTDGVNEIKKVNITKALDTNITYPAGSNDAEKLLEITLAKKPPLEPLTFEFRSDDTINSNNIYEKSFQFAYQYIYRDGEVSALSPISSVAFSPWAANRANIRPPYTTADNHIRLTMKTSTEAVEKVRVLMRNNNIDTFALVKDIEVTTAGTDETYDFYNDGLYPLIATNESDKPYDAVPKKAQALTISNNRLFLGNYTEGFDYELPANINLKAHYLPTPKGVDASVSKQLGQPKNIDIDLSNLPDLIEGNRSVFVKIALEYTEFNVGSPSGVNTFDIIIGTTTKTYNVYDLNVIPGTVVFATEIKLTNAQYTKAQFGAACATAIGNLADQEVGAGYSTSNFSKVAVNDLATQYNSNFEGSMVFEIDSSSYDSVNDKIDVNVNVKSYDLVCTYIQLDRFDYAERITDTFTYNGGYTLDGGADSNISYFTLPISPNEVTTFKSNADHSFGIVYYDDRGRATGVRDIGSVHVASWGAGERDGRNGAAKVIVDIPNDAPASASAYSIVYAKNNRYDNYQQYSVMEAFKATNEDIAEVGAAVGNENIYVSLASIQGKEDSYGSAKVPGVKFTAAEGDKLRIVRYYDRTKGEYVYPEDHEFEVIGIKTFNHENSPIDHDHTAGTDKQQEYRITGDFLVLRNELYPGFAHSALGTADTSGTDNWHEAVTVELYTPKRSTDVKLYYEMGYNFLVNSSGKHVGNATTQGETQEIDIISQVGQTITIAGSDELTISPGDYVTFSRTPGATQYQINSIQYTSTTTIIEFVSAIPASQSQIFWTASVSRVVVKDGDCFLVPKELRYHDRTVTYAPNNFDNKVYETNFVESNNITDYFDSETLSYGKAYAIIDNEREVTRKASITYSDPYNQSSRRLTLSNFTPANIPFYDFDVSKGGIYGLVDMKNYIMGLQEDSVMKIPVGANILDSASGDNIPTISTNVLARPIEYQGVFGINTQRDAFISFEGAVFLADIYRGKMWKVTNDAVAEISDTGMSSYFNKKFSEFKTYESSTNKVFIKLGFDRDNNELIVSGVKYNGTAFTDDFTVAYNFRRDLWSSFYSFVGEGYAELNNVLYSFKNGKAYSHNSNNSRNTFYGTSYTSKIEIVSNPNPSMVKSWEALNIEGDTAWNFTAYTTDQETSTVTTLSKKERLFYSHIPRDTSSISTSEFITLGEVTDIDNNDNVTISNPINKIPFSGGDAVYADGVDTSEVMTALTARNKFTMSDVNVLSVGDIVSVKKNSELEGDQLRDRYIRIKLEKSSSTALELYGVGVVFDRSRLHNDLVN